jgi:hypothetical protein
MIALKDGENCNDTLQMMSGQRGEGSPDQDGQVEKKMATIYEATPQLVGESTGEYAANCDDARHEVGSNQDKAPTNGNTTEPQPVNEAQEKDLPIEPQDTVDRCGYPTIPDPQDPARILNRSDLWKQRIIFWSIIASLNIGMTMIAVFAHTGMVVFVFILFIKSKDFLSSLLSAFGLLTRFIYRIFRPLSPVSPQWILTLIPAYSESEEQIIKTIYSLRDNDVGKHRQVMVVLLDGRHRDVRSHMTRIIRDFKRPYVSLKQKRGVLKITAGFVDDVPVIVIEKLKNSGKMESEAIYGC